MWLFQALYFNRYSQNRYFDITGLLFNMFVMVYLANNINTEWRITFQHFNLAMVAMLVDLIMQYWIGTSKDEENDKKPFILILAIEFLLAIIGLLVGYQIGICIIIVGYICGFLLPLLMYDKFQAGQVNFPHLVERVSLIVIIAFGEAIVNLASYFNSETPITYAVLLFVSLCSMFAAMWIFLKKSSIIIR